MKIALAQMSMTADIAENLKKSLAYCDEAAGCDLLFFPEIQLSPFFPQDDKKNVDAYAMGEDAEALRLLAQKAGEHSYLCPDGCGAGHRSHSQHQSGAAGDV